VVVGTGADVDDPARVVAVFGAGPVGQLAALSPPMQGAGRVLITDGNADRLETARQQNAETTNFNAENPRRGEPASACSSTSQARGSKATWQGSVRLRRSRCVPA
jgi:threonine dehydrogenase-like Zn-dependent dehydrogenase